jgi:hypothetical protein
VRRETRVNLIFLISFVILALPGAVILFRKKLDPTAHRLDQPDPILSRLPYMSPLPAPPDIKWIVPDKTQVWVESLTAPFPTLSAGPPGPQWEPVISADHLLQILSIRAESPGEHLTLLLWSDLPEPKSSQFTVTVDETASSIVDARSTPVPNDVRRELVVAGFIHPPKDIVFLNVKTPLTLTSSPHRLELSYTGPGSPIHTAVDFKAPASPASLPQ